MLYYLLYFIGIMLVITGLFFIFYIAAMKRELSDDGYFVAVEGYDNNPKLSKQIFSAFIQINLFNFAKKRPVYVVDRNLTEETRRSLTEDLEPYVKIIFITTEDKL